MPIEAISTERTAPEPTEPLASTVLIVTPRRWFSAARNCSQPLARRNQVKQPVLRLIGSNCLGMPVIATAVGGVPDLITHEENGLLVPPKDASALAPAMARLALDAALQHRLSNAAQQTSLGYSPAAQKERLIAVYRAACAA